MSEESLNPDTIIVNGKLYLTLIGFNSLRAHFGLESVRPLPGETVEAFKDRYRVERKEFFVKYGHLFDPSMADEEK